MNKSFYTTVETQSTQKHIKVTMKNEEGSELQRMGLTGIKELYLQGYGQSSQLVSK